MRDKAKDNGELDKYRVKKKKGASPIRIVRNKKQETKRREAEANNGETIILGQQRKVGVAV
jgi:hypothetical protein